MQFKKLDHLITRKLYKKWFHGQYINLMNKQVETNTTVAYSSYEQSPIIVLGMHRSGTSLLIDALTSIGLFAGDITGPDTSESLFFQYMNDAALSSSQAHWSNPENLAFALNNKTYTSALLNLYQRTIDSHWKHLYKLSAPQKNLNGDAGPFGWKDPRNCLTIPLWTKLYPNARYIFIHRHGLDVAQSHVNREHKINNSIYVTRCLDLGRSFSLWEEYNRQAMSALANINDQQIMTLSFESLLESPKNVLMDLAHFCGLNATSEKFDAFAKHCDKSKIFAYKNQTLDINSDIKESKVLQQFGYSI